MYCLLEQDKFKLPFTVLCERRVITFFANSFAAISSVLFQFYVLVQSVTIMFKIGQS